jgi:hypothetical protein
MRTQKPILAPLAGLIACFLQPGCDQQKCFADRCVNAGEVGVSGLAGMLPMGTPETMTVCLGSACHSLQLLRSEASTSCAPSGPIGPVCSVDAGGTVRVSLLPLPSNATPGELGVQVTVSSGSEPKLVSLSTKLTIVQTQPSGEECSSCLSLTGVLAP